MLRYTYIYLRPDGASHDVVFLEESAVEAEST